MANYNTFVVVNCKARSVTMVTSSARKACSFLEKGVRVEVWSNNALVDTIYAHYKNGGKYRFAPYIELEREYIRKKQDKASKRNSRNFESHADLMERMEDDGK